MCVGHCARGWGFRNGKNPCLPDHPEHILPCILLLINIILDIMPNVQMRLMDIEAGHLLVKNIV